jgi:hypothetical protein
MRRDDGRGREEVFYDLKASPFFGGCFEWHWDHFVEYIETFIWSRRVAVACRQGA